MVSQFSFGAVALRNQIPTAKIHSPKCARQGNLSESFDEYAIFEGQRSEPRPGLAGKCPSCDGNVLAKCGERRVWHWAHQSLRVCDHWWEPETSWHRNWKNEFPVGWQEIVHTASDGEKHIADLKTATGMVIEFQHSFLKADERMAREAFYRKMVWVVDGRRRARDAAQLLKCIGPCVSNIPPIILYGIRQEKSALLKDWNASPMPVYFDLGISEGDVTQILWRRDPISRHGKVYMTPVSRESFLKVHREGLDAEERFSEGVSLIIQNLDQATRQFQPLRPIGFQQQFTYKSRFRGRL